MFVKEELSKNKLCVCCPCCGGKNLAISEHGYDDPKFSIMCQSCGSKWLNITYITVYKVLGGSISKYFRFYDGGNPKLMIDLGETQFSGCPHCDGECNDLELHAGYDRSNDKWDIVYRCKKCGAIFGEPVECHSLKKSDETIKELQKELRYFKDELQKREQYYRNELLDSIGRNGKLGETNIKLSKENTKLKENIKNLEDEIDDMKTRHEEHIKFIKKIAFEFKPCEGLIVFNDGTEEKIKCYNKEQHLSGFHYTSLTSDDPIHKNYTIEHHLITEDGYMYMWCERIIDGVRSHNDYYICSYRILDGDIVIDRECINDKVKNVRHSC